MAISLGMKPFYCLFLRNIIRPVPGLSTSWSDGHKTDLPRTTMRISVDTREGLMKDPIASRANF